MPPCHGARSVMNFHFMPFLELKISEARLNVLALSLITVFGSPLRAANLSKAAMKSDVFGRI